MKSSYNVIGRSGRSVQVCRTKKAAVAFAKRNATPRQALCVIKETRVGRRLLQENLGCHR